MTDISTDLILAILGFIFSGGLIGFLKLFYDISESRKDQLKLLKTVHLFTDLRMKRDTVMDEQQKAFDAYDSETKNGIMAMMRVLRTGGDVTQLEEYESAIKEAFKAYNEATKNYTFMLKQITNEVLNRLGKERDV